MNDFITIVSGLPRCGTSVMMQVLEAGGLEILTDNIRKADIDNPKGYYELEKVKKIKEDSSWLGSARGKVFKMVSMLLYDLPKEWSYKVVFMKRSMDEIIRSQKIMLERQRPEKAEVDNEKLIGMYEKHLKHVQPWLGAQENMDVVFVTYKDLLENPEKEILAVIHFLGRELDLKKMVDAVDRSLYRNRSGEGRDATQ